MHASFIILGILIHTIYIYSLVIYDVIHYNKKRHLIHPSKRSIDRSIGWIDRMEMRWDGACHSFVDARRGRSRALDASNGRVFVVVVGIVSRSMSSRGTTFADDAWETTRGWRRHHIPRHHQDE